MRRLFGCPDIVSLTEKFLMARNFYRIFTENNPVMGDSKTFGIPEAKGLNSHFHIESSHTGTCDDTEQYVYLHVLSKGLLIVSLKCFFFPFLHWMLADSRWHLRTFLVDKKIKSLVISMFLMWGRPLGISVVWWYMQYPAPQGRRNYS